VTIVYDLNPDRQDFNLSFSKRNVQDVTATSVRPVPDGQLPVQQCRPRPAYVGKLERHPVRRQVPAARVAAGAEHQRKLAVHVLAPGRTDVDRFDDRHRAVRRVRVRPVKHGQRRIPDQIYTKPTSFTTAGPTTRFTSSTSNGPFGDFGGSKPDGRQASLGHLGRDRHRRCRHFGRRGFRVALLLRRRHDRRRSARHHRPFDLDAHVQRAARGLVRRHPFDRLPRVHGRTEPDDPYTGGIAQIEYRLGSYWRGVTLPHTLKIHWLKIGSTLADVDPGFDSGGPPVRRQPGRDDPANVRARNSTTSVGTVIVTADANTDTDFSYFALRRNTQNLPTTDAGWTRLTGNFTNSQLTTGVSDVIAGATAGQTYYYYATANSSTATSQPSAVAQVTIAAPDDSGGGTIPTSIPAATSMTRRALRAARTSPKPATSRTAAGRRGLR
jgi:hypothetical protein